MEKKEVTKCCICGKELKEKEFNNPRPYKEEGEACDECNLKYVIPSRIEASKKENK
jgi:DNA-directed RNA polymerase subunit RPC12/RpoP